jgi:pyruvyltransferase
MPILAFWYKHNQGVGNFGDELTKPILEYFLKEEVEYTEVSPKLLATGSIIALAKPGDIVWGSGLIDDERGCIPDIKVLALRGPLTARNLGIDCYVFGDPAILLPLIYQPKTDRIYGKGYTPHYTDWGLEPKDGLAINLIQPWQTVVDQICSCKEIVSTSLHGIIVAEVYGIPVIYQPSYSGEVIGGNFKFLDYLLGTGRTEEDLYKKPIPPIQNLKERQDILIQVLCQQYAKKE